MANTKPSKSTKVEGTGLWGKSSASCSRSASRSPNRRGGQRESEEEWQNWGKACTGKKAEAFHRNRERVAKELLSTEETYVSTLNVIVDKFQKPMYLSTEGRRKPILPMDEVRTLFSDIAVMRDLNQKILRDLKARVQEYTINTCIGDILLDFVPYLRMYRNYVEKTESEKVRTIIRRLDPHQKSTFKTFCDKTSAENKCLPLPALLITPVQRIPRYRLLIKQYIKHTHETHPDYKKLMLVLERIEETAEFVNQSLKLKAERTRIIEIMQLFRKDPEFVAPHRLYRFDGWMTKKLKNSDDRKYHFFLFNDMLAYAHGKKGGYILHRKIPINGAFEIRDITKGSNELHSFQIINSEKSIQVYCESKENKATWISALRAAKEEWAETKSTRSNRDGKRQRRQMAVPDVNKLKRCNRQCTASGKPCGATFGFFRKRRFCYTCGVVCCESCSPYRVYINPGDTVKQRVCTSCIIELLRIAENQLLYRPEDLPPTRTKEGLSPPRVVRAESTENAVEFS
uniref:Uncharacterized protein n=1 Tax=Lotharella globosa TaxID=91324 RepID=A0A7S4DX78_9EUKA|mmetsp:Transcript_547/g.1046  ORF Transcript_547/g.1046 Transcript_547/m.1046 type:complete len:514 (-) Transcript_547:94-1635(-)